MKVNLNLSSIRLNYWKAIAVPLKNIRNFWRSLKVLLINCKVKLKLKWTKYCVLAGPNADNANADSDNIFFIIIDTKVFVPVLTFSAKESQKLLKLLSKKFEGSVC